MSISKFNTHTSFTAYECITVNELEPLLEKSYKTEGGIFALCSKGSLKTIINHTEYRIRANELIALPPESFLQLLAASDDLEIHTVMFSQQLIQNAGMGKNMMDKFYIIGKHYVFPLSEGTSILYAEMFTFLSHLYKEVGEKLSDAVSQSFLSLMLQGVSELCPEQTRLIETPGSRHFQQYRIFVRLVHADYVQEHQVAHYAKKMHMQPSALCRLVKKESGHTAMEIINIALIMDAKTQLCTENTPVKDIALSLGFNNAAFFNKFFKKHTGVTPQMFRNSVR
ncbi:MAG: AraC family transcriptional regulator [Bacteroides sp.]|uniref:helix-turn-helix domain-containing protein n=1 Tax=Bacteroides sp. TaxID=29523 RepID=UPI0025C44355|nr:helix-turn-helix domain-containing protein [Bacteroides sp.]MBS6239773.1 AraC family transcriptional regulator [Bacteroides sp.]